MILEFLLNAKSYYRLRTHSLYDVSSIAEVHLNIISHKLSQTHSFLTGLKLNMEWIKCCVGINLMLFLFSRGVQNLYYVSSWKPAENFKVPAQTLAQPAALQYQNIIRNNLYSLLFQKFSCPYDYILIKMSTFTVPSYKTKLNSNISNETNDLNSTQALVE